MKTAQQQLSTYKSVHLNPNNIRTHFIGVPLIIWSIALLMSTVSWSIEIAQSQFHLSLAMLFFALALIYYVMLHWRLAIGLALFIVPVVYSAGLLATHEFVYFIAVGVFAIGWIFQFIGHHFEKAKPAFVDDLNQLMIGPFFLMAELYFMLGLEKALLAEITPIAIAKRRALENTRKEKVV